MDDAVESAIGAYSRFLPAAEREAIRRYADVACRVAGQPASTIKDRALTRLAARAGRAAPAPRYAVDADTRRETLHLGDASAACRSPTRPELVPQPRFVAIHSHMWLLRDALLEWSAGHHLLLVGNQGVGKNKLADRLLELLKCEREYVQLHRDTTIASLTTAPVLDGGVLTRGDSPLVRALRHGRALVVDEADKAPLEVVCVLKALVEDGDLQLADGRRVLSRKFFKDDPRRRARDEDAADDDADDQDTLWIHPDFRMIVLANRPGHPFQGNDFYRECGDAFATFAVDNPEVRSETQMPFFISSSFGVPSLSLRESTDLLNHTSLESLESLSLESLSLSLSLSLMGLRFVPSSSPK